MPSTEEIKLLLEIQQKAFREGVEVLFQDVNNRLKQVELMNLELKCSLEFSQKEVEDCKNINKVLQDEVSYLKKEIAKKSEVDDKIEDLKNRVDYHEDYSRRNNLRFDGIEEKNNETWEETQETVQRILRDKLDMGSVELERAHRVGPRPSPGVARPRTVVVRFTKFNQRQQALRNSARLKNTNIYINEDLCESSVRARKEQLPSLRRAKAEGKIAYFNYTKLVIRDRGVRGGDSGSGPNASAAVDVAVVRSVDAPSGTAAAADAGGVVSTRRKDSRDISSPRYTRQKQGRMNTK